MDTTKEFENRDALLKFVQDYCRSKGYFISTKKSIKKKVWIKCRLGGTYRSRISNLQRKSSSRLINCPFSVVAREFTKLGVWKILEVVDDHNHEPQYDPSAYSSKVSTMKNDTLSKCQKTIDSLPENIAPPLLSKLDQVLDEIVLASNDPSFIRDNSVNIEVEKQKYKKKSPSDIADERKCSKCGVAGHTMRTCGRLSLPI